MHAGIARIDIGNERRIGTAGRRHEQQLLPHQGLRRALTAGVVQGNTDISGSSCGSSSGNVSDLNQFRHRL